MDEETGTWSKVKTLATGIYRIWIGERPGPLAASLAYYGIFSIVPVTYVAVVISGIFVDSSTLIVQIEDQLEELLGPEAVEQLTNAVAALRDSTNQGTTLASVISFIVLLFTASLIFFQLQYVLNNVWKAPPPSRDETRNYVRNRLLAFVMVLSVGLILTLATVANIIISLIITLAGLEGALFLVNCLGLRVVVDVSPGANLQILAKCGSRLAKCLGGCSCDRGSNGHCPSAGWIDINYQNCPDILVNSFCDLETDEGCAFEELIGFRGGMGGAQTHPFILHPVELKVPDQELIGAASIYQLAKGWLAELQAEPLLTGDQVEYVDQHLQYEHSA
ncbi:MAG: YihY/virulence factor BrkB family protein [Chloroflexota bacterium]|jgi:hypothetical protein